MAAIPLSEIFSEVQIRARDLTGRDHRPAFIRRIIQHSWDSIYREIVNIQEDFFLKKATISFVADQRHYNLPADYFKMRQVRRTGGVTDEYPLEPTQSTNKDEWTAPWPLPRYQVVTDSDSNTPTHYYIEARQIGMIPAPSVTTTDAVTLEYIPTSPRLAFVPVIFDSADLDSPADVEEGVVSTSWWTAAGSSFGVGAVPSTEYRWRMLADTFQVTDSVTGITYTEYASATPRIERVKVLRGTTALTFSGVSQTLALGPTARGAGFEWGNTSLTGPILDLGSATTDHVIFSVYVWDASRLTGTNPRVAMLFYTSSGNTYATSHAVPADITVVTGWNHFAVRKSSFTTTGSPSWQSIAYIRMHFRNDEPDWVSTTQQFTLDGFMVVDATGIIAGNITNITSQTTLDELGLTRDGPAAIRELAYSDLNEWLVIESVLRLQMQTGKPESGLIRLREEVRRNVLQSMPQRQLQRMPHIGDSRRRL